MPPKKSKSKSSKSKSKGAKTKKKAKGSTSTSDVDQGPNEEVGAGTDGKETTNEEIGEEAEEKKKPPDWRKSAAKAYLYALIVDNKIPSRDEITPKKVFETHCKDRPEFKDFQDYTHFASRLLSLRKKSESRGDRAKEDADALAHDRKIFPAPTEDTKGQPMWKGSKAQELLRKDIKDGLLDQIDPITGRRIYKPKGLYEMREEYHEKYSLDSFRNRIYQEIKFDKRLTWVESKVEAKMGKLQL